MNMLPAAPWFNPTPRLQTVELPDGGVCVVIDDVLHEPEVWAEWAANEPFTAPRSYPYPGLVLEAPSALKHAVLDCFAQRARALLGARRTLDASVRFSLISTPPEELTPVQWLCHRDRVSTDAQVLFAASVLYLFRNPALGGTSFYRPLLAGRELDRLLIDSQTLDAQTFSQRRPQVRPGYMDGSNAFFERVASIPAAWNRMIIYDGGLFHSADVESPAQLSRDPRLGRLTLNAFFTCRRGAPR
ncbi:MAG: hypothetical protein JO006_14145 [Paucibacter sp.]|nr:hypothetical protein [Roseateles sp.]